MRGRPLSTARFLPRLGRVAALLLAGAALAAQAQYKWTDHDGKVSYGDQPGKDAEHVERIGPVSGPTDANSDALARLPFEIRRAAHDFPVIFYTSPDCAPCEAARAFLKGRNIPYSERSVVTKDDVAAYRQLGGKDALPGLSVGRQVMRGFDEGAWSEALATAGYPRDLPLPRDWQWLAATPLAPPPPPLPPGDAPGPAPLTGSDTH